MSGEKRPFPFSESDLQSLHCSSIYKKRQCVSSDYVKRTSNGIVDTGQAWLATDMTVMEHEQCPDVNYMSGEITFEDFQNGHDEHTVTSLRNRSLAHTGSSMRNGYITHPGSSLYNGYVTQPHSSSHNGCNMQSFSQNGEQNELMESNCQNGSIVQGDCFNNNNNNSISSVCIRCQAGEPGHIGHIGR